MQKFFLLIIVISNSYFSVFAKLKGSNKGHFLDVDDPTTVWKENNEIFGVIEIIRNGSVGKYLKHYLPAITFKYCLIQFNE